MANNPFFSDEAAKAAVDAVAALCNSGTLKIYTGSQPTDANTALGAQTLLATLTLSSTAFAASSASGSAGSKIVTATANTITDDSSADATGTAAWFRVLKSNGTSIVMDGSVGTSGCDLNLATTSIVSGADVAITSFTITMTE
jgi:uncharacterized glyoxalase superfamily protein PhnB